MRNQLVNFVNHEKIISRGLPNHKCIYEKLKYNLITLKLETEKGS